MDLIQDSINEFIKLFKPEIIDIDVASSATLHILDNYPGGFTFVRRHIPGIRFHGFIAGTGSLWYRSQGPSGPVTLHLSRTLSGFTLELLKGPNPVPALVF